MKNRFNSTLLKAIIMHFRRSESFHIRDVRKTSDYSHLRYCHPRMSHDDILKKLIPTQGVCFLEDEHVHTVHNSCTLPIHRGDGIYDIWLSNLRAVEYIRIKAIEHKGRKRTTATTLYETQVHPSETHVQIPLSLPESQRRVGECFHHFLRDGTINVSYIPMVALGIKTSIVIELNEGASAMVHLSTVYLANRQRWYLATHTTRFYIAGQQYIVSHHRVQRYNPSPKRSWWERIIPLFGLRIYDSNGNYGRITPK